MGKDADPSTGESVPPPGQRSELRKNATSVPVETELLRAKAGLSLEAILLDRPGQPTVPIKCRDTSLRGMDFFSQHAFEVGDRFTVQYHFANADDRLVLCQVRHCAAMGADGYQGGVEFVDAVSLKRRKLVIPRRWVKGSGQ